MTFECENHLCAKSTFVLFFFFLLSTLSIRKHMARVFGIRHSLFLNICNFEEKEKKIIKKETAEEDFLLDVP